MKNQKKLFILVALLLLPLLIGSSRISYAQTAPDPSPSTLCSMSASPTIEEKQSCLITLLMRLITLLEAQMAQQATQPLPAPQVASTTIPVAPEPIPAPQPTASSVSAASSAPDITATATQLEDGRYKIEWLATQADRNDVDCSSPQLGKVGSQGITIRSLSLPASFEFDCVDKVTNVASSKTITVQ